MSAQIVDDLPVEQNELEALEAQQATKATGPSQEDIPEKYRGKTAAEIAKIALEQEKFIGRQAQEVGEIRRVADQLILERLNAQQQQRQAESQPAASDELSDVDFFANPTEAVKKAVENHPAVQQAHAAAVHLRQRASLEQLQKDHPDYKDLVNDPDFKDWVGQSRVRQALFVQAHRNFDVEAANELFGNYKGLRQRRSEVVQQGAQELRQQQDRALRAVAVPTAGSGQSGKKIFRRADLITLQIKDPDRYMQMQDEIMSAYAEGRVR